MTGYEAPVMQNVRRAPYMPQRAPKCPAFSAIETEDGLHNSRDSPLSAVTEPAY
jgi:hypothetical protein